MTDSADGVPRLGSAWQAALTDFASGLASSDEPGTAIGVYTGGELAAAACAGCAIPEHGVPVTEHTAFDIASVSKHTTAACMLLLARDGLLDLDADIRRVLPELALAAPVTLRQCLTHTAGLRDYFALCDLAGLPFAGITEDRFMNLVGGQRELEFPAGSAFSYSNTGYALASVIVRRLTGKGLAAFATERVFGPLGMTATHFRDDVSVLVPRLAGGYLADAAGPGFRRCDVTEEVVGDGAIVTTVADLAGWHSFMANGSVLGAEVRDGLLARQVLTGGTRIGYALGLESIDVSGSAAWWHSGSWAGYRAAVIYLPGLLTGVSVLANRNDRYASHVALAVAESLVSGADMRSRAAAGFGTTLPGARADGAAAQIAGLWHEPELDVFLPLGHQAGCLSHGSGAGPELFALGADGRWHGIRTAAGGSYELAGDRLIGRWGLSDRPVARYQRVPAQSGPALPPAPGIFRNEELRVYADLRASAAGEPEIAIGLARPRSLSPAGPGAWYCASTESAAALTVRVGSAGASLLVSVPGARRVRFDRVTGPVPADRGLPRGLSSVR